jgi:hypothetical protein
VTKAFPARAPLKWIARAMSSLPVPLEPWIRTGQVESMIRSSWPEDSAHRVGRADDRRVVVAPALAPELGADDGELAVLVADATAELGVQALDLPPRLDEALVLVAKLGDEPRVPDRDRGLVREQVDEVEVLLARSARAGAGCRRRGRRRSGPRSGSEAHDRAQLSPRRSSCR